jgi:hypothetical protein
MKPHPLCVILAQPTEDTHTLTIETKRIKFRTRRHVGLDWKDFLFSAMLQFKAQECCLPAV